MTVEQTLTDDEQLAGLDLEQLRQLVGLVEYDSAHDPFPVSGWDGLEWIVGNATQKRRVEATHGYQRRGGSSADPLDHVAPGPDQLNGNDALVSGQ